MQYERVPRETFEGYLRDLALKAYQRSPFDTICAILRVDGLRDAKDPFAEAHEALDDYQALLRHYEDESTTRPYLRVGLLMYCQLVEMTAPHELLANLLSICKGEPYRIRAFKNLEPPKGKQKSRWVPASATKKFRNLKDRATEISDDVFGCLIESFFNADIRNAFSHADYVLTGGDLRWTEGGLGGGSLAYDGLTNLIANAFSFYSSLFSLHTAWLRDLGRVRAVYPLQNFRVLELLSAPAGGLYGFKIHFSNGSSAEFSRGTELVMCRNICFNTDGSLQFIEPNSGELVPIHKIYGVPLFG
jgi:hypothetical protein